jgi:hypothetical protein
VQLYRLLQKNLLELGKINFYVSYLKLNSGALDVKVADFHYLSNYFKANTSRGSIQQSIITAGI